MKETENKKILFLKRVRFKQSSKTKYSLTIKKKKEYI